LNERLARIAVTLLAVAGVLGFLALAWAVVFGILFRTRPMEIVGAILLVAVALVFALSFLTRAASQLAGSYRNRYAAVGYIGLLAAAAIWLRDFAHVGPRGSWLWLIMLILFGAALPLLWEDFH
jgi:vacuolar-type H+-ATPase subunit I/STV1